MTLPYSLQVTVKVASFLLIVPVVIVNVGVPVGAIIALSGIEIPDA